jgi:hypothetical protein
MGSKIKSTQNFQENALGQNGFKTLSGTPTTATVLFSVIHIMTDATVTATNNCGKGDSFSSTALAAGYYYGRFSDISISAGTAIAYHIL